MRPVPCLVAIKCIDSIFRQSPGCMYEWQERRYIDLEKGKSWTDFLNTKCPNCGNEVALDPIVRERVSEPHRIPGRVREGSPKRKSLKRKGQAED